MLKKKIARKGSSDFVLIPKTFLENLNLTSGDEINIKLDNGKIVISPINKSDEKGD